MHAYLPTCTWPRLSTFEMKSFNSEIAPATALSAATNRNLRRRDTNGAIEDNPQLTTPFFNLTRISHHHFNFNVKVVTARDTKYQLVKPKALLCSEFCSAASSFARSWRDGFTFSSVMSLWLEEPEGGGVPCPRGSS